MATQSKTDLISTELIKLKIQGKKPNIIEFKKRFNNLLAEMDCMIMDETPIQRNRNKSPFYRKHVFVGLNRRKNNGR